MKKMIVILLIFSAFASAGTRIDLAPATNTDLTSPAVLYSASKKVIEMPAPREAVSMSWAIDPAQELHLGAQSQSESSKEFWMEVSGSDFNEGVSLKMGSNHALVRISPMNRASAMPALADLVLVNEEGRSFSNGSGLNPLLDSDQLSNSKVAIFTEGTSVFEVAANVGSGEVLLFADNINYDDNASYLVHVRENESDVVLNAQTSRQTYLAGQTLEVNASMFAGKAAMNFENLTGELIAPSGQTWPLNFANNQASMVLPDGSQHPALGLWEVRVTATASHKDSVVRRDLRTAFAVGEATARLQGSAEITSTDAHLSAALDLEVVAAGRFEVRGLLYGHNEAGSLVPLAVGHSADWLEPGAGSITLSFEKQLIEESGLQAPFVVRDLRLIHQNRMSLIHHQREGFAFPAK